ncbi:hypothetical protein [Streptomyces sp. 11-1-2]|uniref:hypothetical protein n=1 Tax=unclassified Streptomyces TaxID=2593676 RepID=UPI0013C3EC92|nr:hypothetical protein [Streptomyces sp. 11-1-2]
MVTTVAEKRRRRRKQTGQIFVNASGGRRQLLALAALAVGCACLGYLLLLGTALSGVLWQADQEPPRTVERSTTGGTTGTTGRTGTTGGTIGGDQAAGHWPSTYSYGAEVTEPLADAEPSRGGPW